MRSKLLHSLRNPQIKGGIIPSQISSVVPIEQIGVLYKNVNLHRQFSAIEVVICPVSDFKQFKKNVSNYYKNTEQWVET